VLEDHLLVQLEHVGRHANISRARATAAASGFIFIHHGGA